MVDHADHFRGRKLAGYVRVSAGIHCADAQRGIAAQMEAMKPYAEGKGSYVAWYVESDGYVCPVLRQLLDDARSADRRFDTVVVYSFSRLSRSVEVLQKVMSELLELGVTVVSLTESVAEGG